jgi:hypothetical protein
MSLKTSAQYKILLSYVRSGADWDRFSKAIIWVTPHKCPQEKTAILTPTEEKRRPIIFK